MAIVFPAMGSGKIFEMSTIMRRILILVVILVGILAFLGWKVAVFCYSLDFPENFELLVSRCRDAEIVDVAPDGQHLVVKVSFPETEYWLINNVTREHFTLPEPDEVDYAFVTDDLMLYRLDEQYFLWDISTKRPEVLQPLDIDPDQPEAGARLAAMDEIYYLEQVNRVVAFVLDDGNQFTNRYIVINSLDSRGRFRNVQDFLVGNEIDYERIFGSNDRCILGAPLEGCISHNGEFLANRSRVFTIEGDFVMSQSASELPIRRQTPNHIWSGWTHDDTGLFFNFGHGYLDDCAPGGWLFCNNINIPGGVGILKLPEQ